MARPYLPDLERVVARLEPSYRSAMITNGHLVRQFEEEAAAYLGVAHAVAVSSCTAGLMLVVRALVPDRDVVMPSFTFSASAHAVAWNGLDLRFAECDRDSLQLDVGDAAARGDGVGAVMATHVFGAPCPVLEAQALGGHLGVPVIFDAAHAFGARSNGRAVGGFGDAEVFSLTPTKIVVAGEGGLVATRHATVAEAVRLGRDYGNPGDYDTRFVGLNARMSEFHAALALESMARLDDHLSRRRQAAQRYCRSLGAVPGLAPQVVGQGDESTYKDFGVLVNPAVFGMTRDHLRRALDAEGIDTRAYFSPPVHRQQAYRGRIVEDLPVTDAVAEHVVTLPLFGDLEADQIDVVVDAIACLHRHADEATAALSQ